MALRRTGVARPRAALMVLSAALVCCSCASLVRRDGDDCKSCGDGCDAHVRVCETPTVRALAADLDDLERHIDTYGSVVAKVPDVWGQARLTKYRQEFENEVAKNYPSFQLQLQGSLARSDQAFFANSFALGLALQPRSRGGAATASAAAAAPVTAPAATPIPTTELKDAVLRPADGKDVFATVPVATAAVSTGGSSLGFASTGLSIEPTEFLAQKARYLNYLDQIRRTNEGDDTADSPGYSLNLVRVPVSVLPGKRTDVGYGAEVTCTLTPVLGDDLLPSTFRNLVVNDVVKHLGYPVAIMLNDENLIEALKSPVKAADSAFDRVLRELPPGALVARPGASVIPAQFRPPAAGPAGPPAAGNALIQGTRAMENRPNPLGGKSSRVAGQARAIGAAPRATPVPAADAPPPVAGIPPGSVLVTPPAAPDVPMDDIDRLKTPKAFADEFAQASARLAGPATKSKRARVPFPASQIVSVYGNDYAFRIAHSAYKAFYDDLDEKGYAHLPDIRSYLQEEVAAAYKFLSSCENQSLWGFCTPALACAVRTHDYAAVERTCLDYFTVLAHRPTPVEAKSLSAALGWAVLVESALLNEQLVQDMREAATAKGTPTPPPAELPYYLPCPPPEARQAFNAYVALRWPIHVFALDPAVEEQNVADSLVTRRETQLALSLAFATGNMNASNFTKYARRLDAQYETIALNRTQVGFSHGEDTFGWRFYPRFQSPDTEGNLTVLFRDQLIGGPNRDALLRQRRLEPGPRECVAIVLMPSFVPYLNCDVSSNWFKLNNPKHKELDSRDAMRLSRSVKAIQTCAGTVTDADCYRDGDLARLHRKAEQLSARLPLQTLPVQVPYENTLGGFEMFNTGVTDLAPELYGWYGAPGIDVETKDATTTLFLVGDHFSVNQTRVIAGNRAIAGSADIIATAADGTQKFLGGADGTPKLLSRQVAMVKIPYNVLPRPKDDMIEVQVATPYGVTQTIAIPAVRAKKPEAKAAAEGYSFNPEKLTAVYKLLPAEKDTFRIEYAGLKGSDPVAAVNWADASGSVPPAVEVAFTFVWKGATIKIPCTKLRLSDDGGEFPVKKADMEGVVQSLVAYLNTFGPFTEATNPLATVWKTAKIAITPSKYTDPPVKVGDATVAAHAVQTVDSQTALTIEFVGVHAVCPPAGVPAIPSVTMPPSMIPPTR